MIKASIQKKKSFTLIELMIALSIFVIVLAIVVAVLSMIVGSKSKIVNMNKLRTEGSKVMSSIQEMVENGNGSNAPAPVQRIGIWITDFDGSPHSQTCGSDITAASAVGLGSFSTDSKGWRINQILRFNNTDRQIQILKNIYSDGGLQVNPPVGWENILPDNIRLTNGSVSGRYRINPGCITITTKITVSFELEMQTTGAGGTTPRIRLTSTFTPHYPGPDLEGDSVPPAY